MDSSSSNPSSTPSSVIASGFVGASSTNFGPDATESDVLQALDKVDIIMEPSTRALIQLWVKRKWNPQPIVNKLSEKYRGYAQMCNLLLDWLKAAGASQSELESTVEEYLKTVVISNFRKDRADATFESSATPVWLDAMISQATWRSLIYKLSEENENCMLLNFAIKRISDAGHQDEMANVVSAATDAVVFSRVLVYLIFKFMQLSVPDIESALPSFVKTTCYGQYTYLYTQYLLHALGLRRLFQEVQCYARDTKSESIVRGVGIILHGGSLYPHITSALLSIYTSKYALPADVVVLNKAYCAILEQSRNGAANNDNFLQSETLDGKENISNDGNSTSTDALPPLELIRDPDLLENLIKTLFDPKKLVNPSYRIKYLQILAFATCAIDYNVQDGESGLKKIRKAEEFDETLSALDVAQDLCLKESVGDEFASNIAVIVKQLTFLIVSMGVLYWIESLLVNTSYLSNNFNTSTTPLHFGLLDEIAYQHSEHRHLVFGILKRLFFKDFELDPLVALDLKQILLDRMVFLMSLGYVIPVLKFVRDCALAEKVDQSIIRHFAFEVIDMVEPPFSLEFISLLLDIVLNRKFMMLSTRKADQVQLLLSFLQIVSESPVFASFSEALQIQLRERMSEISASFSSSGN